MDITTDNLYTTLLEFGAKKIRDGITYNEMLNYLKGKGLLSNDHGNARLRNTFESLFETEIVAVELNVIKKDDNETKYILKASAFFSFLQFKEYQHSVIAAKEARTFALWAIGIAIASLVVSIVFSVINIFVCS